MSETWRVIAEHPNCGKFLDAWAAGRFGGEGVPTLGTALAQLRDRDRDTQEAALLKAIYTARDLIGRARVRQLLIWAAETLVDKSGPTTDNESHAT
jgi:hypothetical protein